MDWSFCFDRRSRSWQRAAKHFLVTITMGEVLSKPDWGSKHVCASCGAKFYDMKQVSAICPACGTKVKKSNKPTARGTAPTKPTSSDSVVVVTEASIVEDTNQDEILEGTDEVEKKENSIAKVIEGGVAQDD